MRSIVTAVSLVLLLGVAAACEDDDLGFTGTFDLTIVETEDACDGIDNVVFSRVDISGSAEAISVMHRTVRPGR